MIIIYSPVSGSGPFQIVFVQRGLLTLAAKEPPEETGVYWQEGGRLLAIEFDEVKAKEDFVEMTVPETKDKFALKILNGNISLQSTYFSSLADAE